MESYPGRKPCESVKGDSHVPLFLAVGPGLRSASPQPPTIYILDSWKWKANKGHDKFCMLNALKAFATDLHGREPTHVNVRSMLRNISVDVPPTKIKSKAGYPSAGVIWGCPFIVGKLDGSRIAGRADLVEGFRQKMGL